MRWCCCHRRQRLATESLRCPGQNIPVAIVIAARKEQSERHLQTANAAGEHEFNASQAALNALDNSGPDGSAMPVPDQPGDTATLSARARASARRASQHMGKVVRRVSIHAAVKAAKRKVGGRLRQLASRVRGKSGGGSGGNTVTPVRQPPRGIMGVGNFHVTVERAAGLAEADRFGKADPYAIVYWGASGRDVEVHRTEVMRQTLEPVWKGDAGVKLCWPAGMLARKQQQLRIEVWDCDKRDHGKRGTKADKHDDFQGEVRVRAMDLVQALEEGGEGCRKVLKLLPQYGMRATDKASQYVQGDLTIFFKPLSECECD